MAFIRFAITGGAAVLIFVATAFVLRLCVAAATYVASNAAFLVSFACACPMQRGWTFGSRRGHREALPRYLAAQLSCLALSALLSRALVVL